jgi:hypothetical protein
MKNDNSIYLPTMKNFGIWAHFKDPFRNKMAKFVYGPPITHKNDHFAKYCIKIG